MKDSLKALFIWFLKHFSNANYLYEVPSPFPRYTQGQADEVVASMVEMGILKEGSLALPVNYTSPGDPPMDTGSEDPVIDKGHFFIAEPLVPSDVINLYIGDWIIADSPLGLRAHHIVDMWPANGTIEIKTRGTNCIADDKEITNPGDLRYLIRGILY